jgi:hypothetical protein
VALISCGHDLAAIICNSSTSNGFMKEHEGRCPNWWVEALRPMIVVDAKMPEIEVADPSLEAVAEDQAAGLRYASAHGIGGYDLWLVLRGSEDASEHAAKQAMLHLTRFHSERETLLAIARAAKLGRLNDVSGAIWESGWEFLQRSLDSSLEFLSRPQAFGREQAPLLQAALKVDIDHNLHEWDALRQIVDQMRPAVKARMMSVAATSQIVTNIEEQYVMGTGDIFKDIHGSTIVNRSIVQASLNSLGQSGQEELAAALREIGAHLEQTSASSEVVESYENLAEEIGRPDRKKSRIKAFWDQLVELAPSVSALAGAVSAVTSLL